MPIYIYRGGSPNPQPQNPFLRLLVSVGILAAIIGLGVLLLPVKCSTYNAATASTSTMLRIRLTFFISVL